MSSISPRFERTIGATTYAIDIKPVHVALIAAALALALLVALVVVARRRPGALVSPFVPLLAIPAVGFVVSLYVGRHLVWMHGDRPLAAVVFHDVIALDALAAAVGIGASFATVLVVALRSEHQLRLLPFAVPIAILGVVSATAVRHADSIAAVRSMPFYEVEGEHDMHVGREREVRVRLMRPARHTFWNGMERHAQPADDRVLALWSHVDRVHVHPTAEGLVPFTAAAHSGPVTLTTKLDVRALPETASPLLSLRVGDRSVYRVRAKSSDGAVLFFISLAGSETVHEVTVDVSDTRERNGFRTFVIGVSRGESRREVEVVALNGETRLYDAVSERVGKPIVAFTAGETAGPDPIGCSFALLDAPHALCQRGGYAADVPAPAISKLSAASTRVRRARGTKKDAVARPPIGFAGAAPATFEMSTSKGGSGLVTALVAVATIGLVILPDGSSSTSYTLVSTHRGPEGAAEAQPGPRRATLAIP